MAFERARQILGLGLKSIAVHPLRSTLTALGIVFGVGSVIVMLAVGEGARYHAVQQLKDLGAKNIIVRSVKPTQENRLTKNADMLQYGLTYADMERIRDTVPTVTAVTPL